MPADIETEHLETVIIGAGQAGLSAGYHLSRLGRPFVILETHDRVGDVWRRRFDSLRLYSPARYDGLPGMRFPGSPWSYPTKDQMADHLEGYAERFELPVRTGVTVDELARNGAGYVIRAGQRRLAADHVVVASGTWQKPVTPGFAGALDPAIRQLHSDAYHNPSQLQPGPVLVVGASHSGSDIAYDVARGAPHDPLRPDPRADPVPARQPRGARNPARHVVPGQPRAHGAHTNRAQDPAGDSLPRRPPAARKRADLAAAGAEHTDARVAASATASRASTTGGYSTSPTSSGARASTGR